MSQWPESNRQLADLLRVRHGFGPGLKATILAQDCRTGSVLARGDGLEPSTSCVGHFTVKLYTRCVQAGSNRHLHVPGALPTELPKRILVARGGIEPPTFLRPKSSGCSFSELPCHVLEPRGGFHTTIAGTGCPAFYGDLNYPGVVLESRGGFHTTISVTGALRKLELPQRQIFWCLHRDLNPESPV